MMKSLLKKYGVPGGLITLSLILLLVPFLPTAETTEPSLSNFLGRFHPLVVHFPIVFVLIPLMFEGLKRWKKWYFLDQLNPMFIGLGIVSAAFAALVGFFLYRSGGYAGDLMRNHLWAGIGLAICMNIVGISLHYGWAKVQLIGLVAANGLLIYTGHLGGSLTHGEDYLTEMFPSFFTPQAPIEQKPVEELKVFDDIVMSVFKTKCMSCHNEQKAKGGLVMDSYAALQAGGKSNKPSLVAGKPNSSELFHRMVLPLDHDDHMPPKGKSQLQPEELALIYWWIEEGADPDQLIGEGPEIDSVRQALSSYLPQIAHRQVERIRDIQASDKLAQKMIPHLRQIGFEVAIAPNTDSLLFAVSMQFPPQRITDEDLNALIPYAHGIAQLSLVSAEVTDDGLYAISQLRELRHLVLAKTCIKGEGLKYLQSLPKLQRLNLSDTDVDDLAALDLIDFPALREVYLYHSEVSMNVIEVLDKHLKQAKVLHAEGALY